MKAAIVVKIDDNGIKREGLDARSVMDIAIEAIARQFDYFNLNYDIGYNPNIITNERPN